MRDTGIKVTVLMPVHNAEKYIAEAVSSVLAQTFKDFELLIINDGSTDTSMDIVRSFNDSRIVIVDQPRKGIAATLNKGIELARGEYIARFDADDLCYPHRLEKQLEFLTKNRDYILTGSDVDYIDERGKHLFYFRNRNRSDSDIRASIHIRCPFIHSTVCYKTDVVRRVGGYDVKAHTFEDYFLWTRLIEYGKVSNLPQPLVAVRLNPESLSVDEKLRGKTFASVKKQILNQRRTITASQENTLLKILAAQDSLTFKHYSYHVLIAKKYLWNNCRPGEARQHLWKALSYRPFSLLVHSLLLLSWIPGLVINKIYRSYKLAFPA